MVKGMSSFLVQELATSPLPIATPNVAGAPGPLQQYEQLGSELAAQLHDMFASKSASSPHDFVEWIILGVVIAVLLCTAGIWGTIACVWPGGRKDAQPIAVLSTRGGNGLCQVTAAC
mmetsp:Transcript_10998/g.27263  ORF Transcript_10998/g.27263 Transcript_10998/m.27263 type:complete len:117 (+) Transcript_10998:247-597(+)